jgi:CRISPR-associated exonuclease Cas4
MKDLKTEVYLMPSDVLEYLYCPRFIYFERVLAIPQHQELRYKVQMGRELHNKRALTNRSYYRKKLGCVDKHIDVWMSSPKLHLKGRVDEVLFFDDGTAAPLDYKWAPWKGRVYENQRIQSVIYALLISENFNCEVNRGYICFVRRGQHVEELRFTPRDFSRVPEVVQDMLDIIQGERYPEGTSWKKRCPDCCYRNICV